MKLKQSGEYGRIHGSLDIAVKQQYLEESDKLGQLLAIALEGDPLQSHGQSIFGSTRCE